MLGIFQLAYELRDEDELDPTIQNELVRNLEWLRMHLKIPNELKDEKTYRFISWFKDTANEPLKRIRSIKAILEDAGYVIDMVKTDDPGIILYSDGWQVVAKPK